MSGSTAVSHGRISRWKVVLCGLAIAGAASIVGPASAATIPPVPTVPTTPTTPSAPTITSATAGQQNATIAFTRPDSDGGAAIVAFRITCTSSNGGAKVKQSGASSPLTVNGMAVGKKYTCTVAAVNKMGIGTASGPSAVVVPLAPPGKGLPDPPTQLHARGEIDAVRLSFRGVYISGGAHVTGYLAICVSNDGGRRNRQRGSTPPLTVDNLTAGKTYTCTVSSRNPAGYGAPSAPSNAVVTLAAHTVPGPPANVSATASARKVTVSFSKPGDDGGELITGYHVTCISKNGGDTVFTNGTSSPIDVTGLTALKTYHCSVAAKNRFGFGKFSAPSNAVATQK